MHSRHFHSSSEIGDNRA